MFKTLYLATKRSTIAASGILLTMSAGCGIFSEPRAPLSEVRTALPGDTRIGEPFGLAFRGDDLFISDGKSGTVWRLDASGALEEFATGLDTPSHIAEGAEGELYVADSGDHTIKKIAPDGAVTVFAGVKGRSGFKDGPAASSLFNAPIGIAWSDGTLYVSDTYNDKLRVIKDGDVRTLAGSKTGFQDSATGSDAKFNTPTGLATLGEHLLVADTGNGRVRIVAADGKTATLAGGGNAGRPDGLLAGAQFSMPIDIAVDAGGTVYVADADGIRAIGRRFIAFVETVAGKSRGFRDGAIRAARFNRPSGLALKPNGDVFVADSENGLVRIITGIATGQILTSENFAARRQAPAAFKKTAPGRWPYTPPSRKREIAGTLGEIRGEIEKRGDTAWFHNGLDIVGGYGETARAVRDEKILRPLAVAEFGTTRENVRFPDLGYVHIRLGRDSGQKTFNDPRFQFRTDGGNRIRGLRIPRGAFFRAGDALGTLNTMNHVHLIAGPSGAEMNALAAVRFPGAADSIDPVIESLDLYDEEWGRIETADRKARIKSGERVRIVIEAYDRMDGNQARRRLGLYKLGYQLLDEGGSPLAGYEKPRWTVEFDRPPSNEFVGLVYAPGSSSGATGTTVFRYIVSNRVNGGGAREGFVKLPENKEAIVLRVFAADIYGNQASKDITIKVF
ncbi:MAG: hypothetical protein OEM82_10840 [Acidobacteriota bacterium]|nr:hypothetical protein [Acidobacteriota bacterium]MDH3529617.1 hypothetical protein [Acidobacteriota bacterium]